MRDIVQWIGLKRERAIELVRCYATYRLTMKPANWQRRQKVATLTVICVYEGLANAQRRSGRRFQVDRYECAGRGPSARQKERLAFLDESVVPVTNGIIAQIWPIVSHANRNGSLLSVGCE